MKLNRKGTTRLVFEFDHVVIKVPNFTCQWNHFLAGLLANLEERDTWKCSKILTDGDKSHLLCPVLWTSFGGWILVMRKADRCLEWDEDDKHDISQHKKYFSGDDKVVNYGILDGRVVKIDYGQL